MTPDAPTGASSTAPTGAFSSSDLAVDRALAQVSESFSFLLHITPVDGEEVKREFLAGRVSEPVFTYRELADEPTVLAEQLARIDVTTVEDRTLGHLLRAKHRELDLQLEMLKARGSADFRALSIELYGGVSPSLRDHAERVLAGITSVEPPSDPLDAQEFCALAGEEIAYYREQAPGIEMHAEIRPDVNGVMVSGDTLLIGPESVVQRNRAAALLHHEVGTHLVTHVNGHAQPVKVLGTGLAGYDETQEGLAVLGEVACGGLTPFRLRQLADRVLTVHRMVDGASFAEAYDALVTAGVPQGSAFTTVMRVFRAGGTTKDAIYLRGVVDLLAHLADDGDLDLLWLGKFSLEDLPLIAELTEREALVPPRLLPRYLDDPTSTERLGWASGVEDLSQLVEGHA
ncbi:flavohemoglobin expression-modulating QEGLA motif protein [Nocardioides jishulii]|uniref:DUF1704 domain-containing protein n=1 Tax=Nocardioides jishulii TaxID=2575440 RepID=A0A4U2YU25_9ACTN|nr:tyrosine/phenylalanine carboxypeptidase domain-containing protein [Nocardioides jishulii]QCX28891.1 DUF1704 domain-containing protein [Nocardioides jishulii]TKI64212.1 DUF1704 domain-containing protein [Nocardioides jishulii]